MFSTPSTLIATTTSKTIGNSPFLTLSYWFSTPDPVGLAKLTIPAILSTLVLISVLAVLAFKLFNKNLTPPTKKFLDKTMLWLVWLGPLGWLLVASRMVGIVFFSARFFWIIWFLILLGEIFLLFRFYQNELNLSLKQYQSYQLKKKYLPKKKKR